jgi:osmotically-inducible protein OsmY
MARHVACNPLVAMHTSDRRDELERADSDAKLRSQVHEQLKRHGRIDATKIGILVRRGQVLLWGSVGSEQERTTAGEIAANVAGRLNVINHIHVFQTLG